MQIKLSVITVTWNSGKYIYDMLDSLLIDLKRSNITYEIFIIDNGSTDQTINIIGEYFNKYDNIHLIRLNKNMGTTISRNIGIKKSKGEYILILDSDTIISRGSIQQLIDSFKIIKSNKIGLIHPKLVYKDNTFQESARKFPSIKSKFYRLFNIEKLRTKTESIDKVLNQEICTVDYAISAAWILKRSVFEDVGYLDENIFYAPEDAEFCARLWTHGYEVWYNPNITIIHDCQRVTNKNPFSKLQFLHLKGLLYFWKKYNIKKVERIVHKNEKN